MEFAIELLLTSIAFFLLSFLIWALVGCRWQNCRSFFHNKSYTYVDICFILAYFFEQYFLLIILSTTQFEPRIVVGIFSLVLITTASLQNRSSQSRIDAINEKVIEQNSIINSTDEQNHKLKNMVIELEYKLKKSREEIYELLEELIEETSKKKR